MCLQVGVLAVADDVKYAPLDRCTLDQLAPLSNRTKYFLNRFIDSLDKESGAFNQRLMYYLLAIMLGVINF
jgi:hypothetical protein